MTDKERDLGRVISITVLLAILLLAMLASCSPYYYQSKGPQVTHVLALTENGDTLKIPIRDIRPNVVYNVVGYDWYRPYNGYYTRWDKPYYHPGLYNVHKPLYSGNSNNNNNNNTPTINRPPNRPVINPPNPAKDNPKKNN
jgi:hypothetical protein